jgi:branched-chain amino acid transport system substrate-binding protein
MRWPSITLAFVLSTVGLVSGSIARGEPVTAHTVKIGVLNDQSGPYADMGGIGSVVAARLAIEDSGLAARGWQIDLVFADHQNKPDLAANIVRQWFDVDKVDAVADVTNSAVGLAVSQVAREKNKAMLASGSATSDLTGRACSPNTVQWGPDTWAFAHGVGKAVVKSGGDTWFFITADYAFGRALTRDTKAVVLANGGKILGEANHPLGSTDFSSYLLQAQSSGAKIIALANSGSDIINAIKQAAEFEVASKDRRLAALLLYISDIHAIGLRLAQGLLLESPFYWNTNDDTRKFAARFAVHMSGRKPTIVHAGVYASLRHYFKAIEALGDAGDGAAAIAQMKAMPTDDPLFGKGRVRIDGRTIYPMYLFQVKRPSESTEPWDYYTLRATIPAEEAFRPLEGGDCPLLDAMTKANLQPRSSTGETQIR